MSRYKIRLPMLFLSMAMVFAGASLWGSTPVRVQAQCGDVPPDSSCIACHETEHPVYDAGEWHILHARKDCCAQCHGGNCSAMDKSQAHEGLIANPLEDIYTNCYHCHPYDYQARAEKFSLALGVTPGSRPTPTPLSLVAAVSHPLVIASPDDTSPGAANAGLGVFLAITAALILAMGLEVRYLVLHN